MPVVASCHMPCSLMVHPLTPPRVASFCTLCCTPRGLVLHPSWPHVIPLVASCHTPLSLMLHMLFPSAPHVTPPVASCYTPRSLMPLCYTPHGLKVRPTPLQCTLPGCLVQDPPELLSGECLRQRLDEPAEFPQRCGFFDEDAEHLQCQVVLEGGQHVQECCDIAWHHLVKKRGH
jgi:hypothetical protein